MIALDTNVLIRLLVGDDAEQQSKVVAMLEEGIANAESFFIPDVVMVEVVWVLKSRYRYQKEEIALALRAILEAEHLEFESIDRCRRALSRYRQGRGGFADFMIAERAQDAKCSATATFDKALIEEKGFIEPGR